MGYEPTDEDVALVALLRTRHGKRTWAELASDVAFIGSARAVLSEGADEALLPSPALADALTSARAELEGWAVRGLEFVSILNSRYPRRLLDIRECPPFLFASGELRDPDPGVSVVGSRNASREGLDFATAVAEHLVKRNLSVIAGLAAGIDTAAHHAALRSGGRTVAFVGTGIDVSYPAENAGLQEEIAARGLLLSQFWPDSQPTKYSFPIRNAAMSGYGLATVIVEAGEFSGTRIQARLAMEHGRPVILSDVVANSTQWGARLVGRPGVYVVGTLSALGDVIDRLQNEEDLLQAALGSLRSTAA